MRFLGFRVIVAVAVIVSLAACSAKTTRVGPAIVEEPTDPAPEEGETDAGAPPDAAPDAEAPRGTPRFVDCPPDPVMSCAASKGCCYRPRMNAGVCLGASGLCSDGAGGAGTLVLCDGNEDCKNGSDCCADAYAASCGKCTIGRLCHSTGVCPPGLTCTGLLGGYYRYCK